jgi:hypothetical protein
MGVTRPEIGLEPYGLQLALRRAVLSLGVVHAQTEYIESMKSGTYAGVDVLLVDAPSSCFAPDFRVGASEIRAVVLG